MLRVGLSIGLPAGGQIAVEENPPEPKVISALIPVTMENVDAFAKNWDKWLPNEMSGRGSAVRSRVLNLFKPIT